MRYPDEIIEEVRQRNDIVDVVSAYVKMKRRGSSWVGLCPFHNEKTPSFSVSRDRQMYHCFGCNAGGNVYTFIMEYENFSFPEAIQFLADRAGVRLPQHEMTEEEKKQVDLKTQMLAIHRDAAKFYFRQLRGNQGRQALDYLRERKLSSETIVHFGLGYALKYSDSLYRYMKDQGHSDELLDKTGLFLKDEKRGFHDKFWNRVIFPIMDLNNRVIGFGGRVMGEGKPKYLNSPETLLFDKSQNLYGLNFARNSRKKELIVCEGYMDVIAMHQAGFTNAVASLGTALTSRQCTLIKRYTQRVLLVYDSDKAGRKAALRAVPLLREAGLESRVIDLSPYKDPDEFIKALGVEEFQKRLDHSKNGFLFQLEMAAEDYQLGDPYGKTEFTKKLAGMLVEIEEEIERSNYLAAAATAYHIDRDMLQREVNRLGLKQSNLPRHQGAGKASGHTGGGGRGEDYFDQDSADYQASYQEGKGRKLTGKPRGDDLAQQLILTWIVTYPGLLEWLGDYVKPEDFTDPLYREIAGLLEEQFCQGELNPARLLNHFTNREEQTRAAGVINARIKLSSDEERKKALADVIFRIRESSMNARYSQMDLADPHVMMQMMEEKRELEKFKRSKLQIPLSVFA